MRGCPSLLVVDPCDPLNRFPPVIGHLSTATFERAISFIITCTVQNLLYEPLHIRTSFQLAKLSSLSSLRFVSFGKLMVCIFGRFGVLK